MFKHCNLKSLNNGTNDVYTKLKQFLQSSHKAGLQELAEKAKQYLMYLKKDIWDSGSYRTCLPVHSKDLFVAD